MWRGTRIHQALQGNGMSRYDVFISYKHNKDEAAAKRIAEIIERQTGLRCWYDEYLRGGDEYDRIIFKRIEECTYFAFVMSEDALQSVYCSAELKHAIHHGKSLVPVNLDNALPLDCIRYDIAINTTAQVRLQKIHWIDYSSTDLEGDIRNAFRIDHAPKTQPDTPSDPAKYDPQEPADAPKGEPGEPEPADAPGEEPGKPESADNAKEESAGTRQHGLPVPGRYLAAGAVVLACVVIAGLWLHRNGGETAGTNATEAVSAETTTEDTSAETEERVYPAGYELADLGLYHVTLYADDEVTVTDFNAAVEALRGRLDVLTDGEDYTLDVVDETGVELYLPRSVFNATDDDTVLSVLLSMVTRRLELGIIDITAYTSSTDYIHVNRSDLAEVSLETGRIPDLDVSDLGYGDEDYPYIRVQLTDALAQDNAEVIAAYGENLQFMWDPNPPMARYYLDTAPAGDGCTFYLLERKDDSRYIELDYYNLTHEPTPFSFSYSLDLNNNAVWERTDEATVIGENQCNVDQLTGDLGVVSLAWYHTDASDGEWLDQWTGLKARLDCLDQPYAVGVIDGREPVIVIATEPSHLGRTVSRLLVQDGLLELHTGTYMASINGHFGGLDFTYEQQEDGSWCGMLTLTDDAFYNDWSMEDLLQRMEETGQPLVLTDEDGYPLMSASAADAIDGSTIRFDRLYFGGDTITDDQVWLLALLDTAIDGPVVSSLHVSDAQYQRRPDGTWPSFDAIEYNAADYNAGISAAIHAVADNATVSFDDMQLRIALHLDVNERLPERAAAMIEEVYQAVGFENSYYDYMCIYLIDEDDETREWARIWYSKHDPSFANLSEPVTVTGDGGFRNGRLEDYKEAFRSIVENDPFYNKVVDGEPQVTWNYGDEEE